MRRLRSLFLPSAVALLVAGCAAQFAPETEDPAAKLKWAELLHQAQADPRPAEQLIWEAIESYRQRDDRRGLAEAYRQYALFLRAPNLADYAEVYQGRGFLDPSVTLDNRLEKSLEYFDKALAIFEAERAHGPVIDIHFAIAVSHHALARRGEACSALDRSLVSYRQAVARQAGGAAIFAAGDSDWEMVIRAGKTDLGGCP